MPLALKVMMTLILTAQVGFSQEVEKDCSDLFVTQENTLVAQVKEKTRNILISLTIKNGNFIAEDDPNGFAQAVLQELDNREILEQNPDAPLKGLNERLESKLQQTSALNGNSQITSYFKYFESPGKSTYEVSSALWSRPINGKLTKEWRRAYKKAQFYLDSYSRLQTDIFKITARGFEALELYSVLGEVIAKYRSKDFAQEPTRSRGISFDKPVYTYNEDTEKIEKTYRQAVVYRYDTLIADRFAAARAYEQVFGLRTSPIRIVQNKMMERTPYDWSRLKNPSYIVLSPFYAVYGLYKFTKSSVFVGARSLNWMWSLVRHPDGEFHERLVEQAFERRRLEIVYQSIVLRLQKFSINPNNFEKQLLTGIEKALRDPYLAPSSNALSRAQIEEYDAERTIVLGKKTITGGDIEKPSMYLYEDIAPQQPITVQGAFLNRAQQKIKQWAPTVIVTGLLIGTMSTQFNNIKERLMDDPDVAVKMTALSNILYDLKKDLFGLDHLIYKEVKESDRTWALENVTLPAATKDGTQIYQDNYRLDPSKNFIADPEYQVGIREIIEVALLEREKRGGAVAFQYTQDQTKNWGYPTRTVKLLMESLMEQYPGEEEFINNVKNRILEDIDQGKEISTKPSQYFKDSETQNAKLLIDLYYLISKSMQVAVDYYAFYGSLLNPQGSIYEVFVESAHSLALLKPSWNVRFTPYKSIQSKLFTNQQPQLAWVVSEVNQQGYVQVEFLEEVEEKSPTDEYFVNFKGLDLEYHFAAIDDTP